MMTDAELRGGKQAGAGDAAAAADDAAAAAAATAASISSSMFSMIGAFTARQLMRSVMYLSA